MSGNISEEIKRIQDAKLNIKAAINEKGGTITNELIDKYPDAIRGLASGGGNTSTGGDKWIGNKDGVMTFKDFGVDGNTIVIPSEIDGKPITKIDNNLFAFAGANFPGRINLIISEGITEIGASAFSGVKIEKLKLPSTLKTISSNAFSNCGIQGVEIPDSVMSIGTFAFSGKGGDANVITKIPEHITEIETESFKGCIFNGDLKIPDSVSVIRNNAFQDCKVSGTVTLSASLNPYTLGQYAFMGAEMMKLIIPDGISAITTDTFQRGNIKEVEISSSVTNIQGGAFAYSNIERVKFNEGLKQIINECFIGNKIKDLYIPNSVKFIINRAFYDNPLETVSIPSTCSYSRAFPSSAVITKREV